MSMSRRDYVAIARVISEARSYAYEAGFSREEADTLLSQVAAGIASHCAHDNQAFDRDRFIRACQE